MFLNKDSSKQEIQKNYYCLIIALFFFWNFDTQFNSNNIFWKQFFHDNQHHLSSWLSWYINNLDLFHKIKEETRINCLQRKTQEAFQVLINLSSMLFDDNIDDVIETVNHFDASNNSYFTAVNQVIFTLIDSRNDWYTWKALNSCEDNEYLHFSFSSLHQYIYHSFQSLVIL